MSKESLSFINFIFEQDKKKKWEPVPKPKAPMTPIHPGWKATSSALDKFDDEMDTYQQNKVIYDKQMDEWEKKNKPKQWAAKQAAKNTPTNPASSYALRDTDTDPLSKKLELIYKENQGALLFIRFTGARQYGIGINPNYSFSTPRGTYAYPYNPKWIEKIKNKDIPYAFQESGVIIFKWDPAKSAKKTIIIDGTGEAIGYTQSDYANDYKKLEEYLLPEYEKIFKQGEQNIYNIARQSAQSMGTQIDRNWIHQQVAQLRVQSHANLQDFMDSAIQSSYKNTRFNKIYNLSRVIAGDAKTWTDILYNVLNISCIYDRDDSSTIHGSEPTQAVFFEPDKATVLLNQENIFPTTKIKDYGEETSKYKLTEFTIGNSSYYNIPPGKYYRIIAKETFHNTASGAAIYAGAEGGIISGEHNLAKDGDAWISFNACVINNAYVGDSAYVGDEAIVKDNAKVLQKAMVSGKSIISDNAVVTGNAKVYEICKVYGKGQVRGKARLYDYSQVFDKGIVEGNARLYGNSKVHGQGYAADDREYYDEDINVPFDNDPTLPTPAPANPAAKTKPPITGWNKI